MFVKETFYTRGRNTFSSSFSLAFKNNNNCIIQETALSKITFKMLTFFPFYV